MIEAELKARLRDPDAVRARLDERAASETATHYDAYYDLPDGELDAQGRELRVRTVETKAGCRRVLTYKDPSAHDSGSKPEYETGIESAGTIREILERLGYKPAIEFTKQCTNYRFEASGRQLLATVVTVPELGGTFLEVETLAEPADLDVALEVVRQVLADFGVGDDELTGELYTDAVRAARTA